MKGAGLLLGSVAVGIVLAVGCADDNRPVVGIEPGAGEANGGSSAGTTQGGKGGAAQGGSTNGGTSAGKAGTSAGGTPEGGAATGGASEGGASEPIGGAAMGGAAAGGADVGGAGGDVSSNEPPPFDGADAIVFVGTNVGIDFRPVTMASFVSNALVDFTTKNNEHRNIGTASNHEVAHDSVLQWGRWADGTLSGDNAWVLSATQGFHYAIGNMPDALPANGTFSYDLKAFTPVMVGDGSKALGVSTGAAVVAFGATTHIGVSFVLSIDGVDYTVKTTGGTATPATSELTATSGGFYPALLSGSPPHPTTGICSDNCSIAVEGIFAGANAEEMAIAIHLFDGAGGSATSVSSILLLTKSP